MKHGEVADALGVLGRQVSAVISAWLREHELGHLTLDFGCWAIASAEVLDERLEEISLKLLQTGYPFGPEVVRELALLTIAYYFERHPKARATLWAEALAELPVPGQKRIRPEHN